jgi:hypothetical protein
VSPSSVISFFGPDSAIRSEAGSARRPGPRRHTASTAAARPASRSPRKLGLIDAEAAVALSLSLTHKAVTFDRRMPEVDFDAVALPSTGVLPVGVLGAVRSEGARNKQQPRTPTPRAARSKTR